MNAGSLQAVAGRAERARQILRKDLVSFLGNGQFMVASGDGERVYNVTQDDCDCLDHKRGNVCKHMIAARMWFEGARLYNRTCSVVRNRAEWQAGQRVTLSETKTQVAEVVEAGQRLWLILRDRRNARRQVRKQVGYLGMKGWTLAFSDLDYKAFLGEAKASHLA
jgi:hypothetical protein